MSQQTDIRTERLLLRAFTPEDIPAILRIYGNERVNRFLPMFPLKDINEARDYYETRFQAAYQEPVSYTYAICLKEGTPLETSPKGLPQAPPQAEGDDVSALTSSSGDLDKLRISAPIGYVAVDVTSPAYDMGWALLPEYWNRGIATEAAAAVVERIRKEGMLPYITATHDRENPASGRVMQKIGMRYGYTYEELWLPKEFTVYFRMYQMNFSKGADYLYTIYQQKYPHWFVEETL